MTTQTQTQLDLREQIVRIDKMIVETQAIKQRTFPAWALVLGIAVAAAMASPVSIMLLDRYLPPPAATVGAGQPDGGR